MMFVHTATASRCASHKLKEVKTAEVSDVYDICPHQKKKKTAQAEKKQKVTLSYFTRRVLADL